MHPETTLARELTVEEEQDQRHRLENLALHRLRRETHRTLRAAVLLAGRALRLFVLLFERVELVRQVEPGLGPRLLY